jgi:hypothetical protein
VNTVTRPNIVPSGTSLQGVNFSGAKIRYCDFDGVNLTNANFHNAVGDYLKFTLDTNLFRTSFRNADMTTSPSLIINADTSDSDLTGVKVSYNRESRIETLHARALLCSANNKLGTAYWSQKFCDSWWAETTQLRVYNGCEDFWDCLRSGLYLEDVDRSKIKDLPITKPGSGIVLGRLLLSFNGPNAGVPPVPTAVNWRSIVTDWPIQLIRSFVRPSASEMRTPVPAPRTTIARYLRGMFSIREKTVSTLSGSTSERGTAGRLILTHGDRWIIRSSRAEEKMEATHV